MIPIWLRRFLSRAQPAGTRQSSDLLEFQARIAHRFADPSLLARALTHRSFAFQEGQERRASNERLEFLGDAVLALCLNEALVQEFPEFDEGRLTKTKSLLASRVVLAGVGRSLGLGEMMRLSGNELESGGKERSSILADGVEALLGALYLDGGLAPARRLVRAEILDRKESFLADESHRNYKSLLQEKVQSVYKSPPRYRVQSTSGPDHSKDFIVEVVINGKICGRGEGRSKKDAEQFAARAALETFGENPEP